ncbi:MAG: caspase family protein [Nitrososphaeraceae archaeon]
MISVSDYHDTKLEHLPFCENDGTRMFEVLNSLGYEITDNKKLIGHVSEKDMREAIRDFFKTAKHKDTLLLYYSGHGIPEIKGDLYLASSEIDQSFPDV